MKRSLRHRAACAWACAVFCLSFRARAQAEPTRLEFRAPAGCSSAEDFAARVRKRSSRIHLVSDTSAARSLVVEIQQASVSAVFRGTATVVERDGKTRTRSLKAASCDEAVEGLSLIATVTLDPDALLAEPATEPSPEPPPAAVVRAPPRFPAARPPGPPPPPAPSRSAESYRVTIGIAAVVLGRAAPAPAFGGNFSAAFELYPGRVFSPLWRLSLTHAERRGLAEPGGDASFAFTLPALDLCPVRFGPRWLGFRPCAFGSVGLLEVWGERTLKNEAHARLAGAAGGALAFTLGLSKTFEIIADGRVGLPLIRDRFAFDGVGFFKTPTPTFSVAAGIAGGFP